MKNILLFGIYAKTIALNVCTVYTHCPEICIWKMCELLSELSILGAGQIVVKYIGLFHQYLE